MESLIKLLQPYARRYRMRAKGAGDASPIDRNQMNIYMVVAVLMGGSMFRGASKLQEKRYPGIAEGIERERKGLIEAKMADRAAMDIHDNRTMQMRGDMK